MEGLELLVVIGATILLGGVVAGRLRIAPPLVLLVLGSALGFIPALGEVTLPPDLVLLLFLPALLYWDSLNTSLREIRSNLRTIGLLAIGLVFATAAVVAVIGHAFGLPWSIAIALGAILSPTDPTAVSSVAGNLPRRTLTTLRGESLINDGTALVLYSVAVAAAVAGEQIAVGQTIVQFLASYGVGIAIGLVVGFLVVGMRRLLKESQLENALSVLTPFIAYLPAELLGVSGVVAVVVAGLVLSQAGPKIISARTRTQASGFWKVTTYLLNGALFVLIGLQFHRILGVFTSGQWQPTVALAALAVVSVVAVRVIWVNTLPHVSRLVDRRASQRRRQQSARERFPLAWAGFRGGVSLAAALALPMETAAGDPFPARATLIAVTFAVILFTLLVQGLSMPAVIRWARLPKDPTEHDEALLAEQEALQAALDALDDEADRLDSPTEIRELLQRELEHRIGRIHRDEENPQSGGRDGNDDDSALRLALLPAKRAAVVRLRDERRIDDVVLRRLQSRIDVEELRLSAAVDES